MDQAINLILAGIAAVLLIYNFILGKKLNNERNKEIKELDKKVKESKRDTKKTIGSLNDLISKYRKLRNTDRDK